MVRICVAGIAGRMGRRIIEAIGNHPEAELAGGFEAHGCPFLGQEIAAFTRMAEVAGKIESSPEAGMAGAEVMINFTAPEPTIQAVRACAELGKAAVVGTTGLTGEQREALRELGREIPLVVAPNMSVGMNLMFKITGLMARVLGEDFALELVEAHHDQKKDSPSGTAVRLLEEMCAARGWDYDKVCAHGRVGMVGARPREEIGVSVIRGGDIVGDHTAYFIGHGERLELTHRAHSRDTFARGAVRAALWVVRQKPGFYDMHDVLGLKDIL